MNRSSSWINVLPSLVIPVCIGMMLYLGMLTLIQHEVITNDTVLRYLTGHPVSKITVAMFFIGMASLLLIGSNVFEQFGAEKKIGLDENWEPSEIEQSLTNANRKDDADDQLVVSALSSNVDTAVKDVSGQNTPEVEFADSVVRDHDSSINTNSLANNGDANNVLNAPSLATERAVNGGKQMLALPNWMHEHYLWQRIVAALQSVYRTGSAANVDEELKYLADLDLDRQQQRYSLVRILIWATPMLGFLGTVLGISQALGGINVGPENDFQTMMNGLRGSLYVAFDTTALALTLSMVMMFGQFLVDRFEAQLLQLVDQRARAEISVCFDLKSASLQPTQQPTDTIGPAGQDVLRAMQLAVTSQTNVWRKTVRAAEQAWSSSLTDVSGQVQNHLTVALEESVLDLAHTIGEAIGRADDSMAHRWEQWQVTLSDNARLLTNHQSQLIEQTGLIQKLLEQTDDVALFQPAINRNQEAIEQTTKLRAAITDLSVAVATLDGQSAQTQRQTQHQGHPDRAAASDSNVGYVAEAAILSSGRKPSAVDLPSQQQVPKRSTGNPSEIILPFPVSPQTEVASSDGTTRNGTTAAWEPREVILPFAKKAA